MEHVDTYVDSAVGCMQAEAMHTAYKAFLHTILCGWHFHPFYKENFTRATFQSDMLEKVRRAKDYIKRKENKTNKIKKKRGRPTANLCKSARKRK